MASLRADSIAAAMRAATDALHAVPRAIELYRCVDDAELLDLTRVAAEEVRLAQLHVSLLAGEIARRSAPELGHSGLSQRTGHRTPDELVRVTTGTRGADARAAVRVGSALASPKPTTLGTAVLDGRVSVAVADAISTGLGAADAAVSATTLDDATEVLIERVTAVEGGLDADRAAREARALLCSGHLKAHHRVQHSIRTRYRASTCPAAVGRYSTHSAPSVVAGGLQGRALRARGKLLASGPYPRRRRPQRRRRARTPCARPAGLD